MDRLKDRDFRMGPQAKEQFQQFLSEIEKEDYKGVDVQQLRIAVTNLKVLYKIKKERRKARRR